MSYLSITLFPSVTSLISYFATYFSESDFLGFTFLLYRTFHHSLHWGPRWRNTKNISFSKESNFRKGEISSQKWFLRLEDNICLLIDLPSLLSPYILTIDCIRFLFLVSLTFHMGSFSFCVKHILWSRIFSWCIIWCYLSESFFSALYHIWHIQLSIFEILQGRMDCFLSVKFFCAKLKLCLFISLQKCVLSSFPCWWSQSYFILFYFTSFPIVREGRYTCVLCHIELEIFHQSCLNLIVVYKKNSPMFQHLDSSEMRLCKHITFGVF